jgi:hypothetical protein
MCVVPTPEAAKQLLETNRLKRNGRGAVSSHGNAAANPSLVQGTPVIGQRTRPLEQMTLADRCVCLCHWSLS